MINYNIYFTAKCNKCNSTNTFLRILADFHNLEEIENLSFNELLDFIDSGELTVCPICKTKGEFEIIKINFNDLEFFNVTTNHKNAYTTYTINSEKKNGEIRAWIEAGYYSVAEVSVAFNSIRKFIDDELWYEPIEGEENGSFEIKVEFYKEPFKSMVHLVNNGYSQDEIIMIINSIYNNIPNDNK